MKMVKAAVINGTPRIQWRDGWDMREQCWKPGADDFRNPWWEFPDIDAALGSNVRDLHSAAENNATFRRRFADEDGVLPPFVMWLCDMKFVALVVKEMEANVLDLNMILTEVSRLTRDKKLHLFVTSMQINLGRWRGDKKQKEKESKSKKTGAGTRIENWGVPSPDEKKRVFMMAMTLHYNANEYGLEKFWRTIAKQFPSWGNYDLGLYPTHSGTGPPWEFVQKNYQNTGNLIKWKREWKADNPN